MNEPANNPRCGPGQPVERSAAPQLAATHNTLLHGGQRIAVVASQERRN